MIILTVAIVALCLFLLSQTKLGRQIWMRIFGTAQEKINQDAATPEGAAAYYNAAIDAKTENYSKAVGSLGQMTGKVKTYEQKLIDCKKSKMKYDLAIKDAVKSGDDDSARMYLRKKAEIEDKIEIFKKSVSELEDNIKVQNENVATLKTELEALKSEKEKSVLELETSQTIQSLKVDSYAPSSDEDKILEKVRDGVQKAKESAEGHKIAYENSESVQQKRLDQRMRDSEIEAKLQELKKSSNL